MDPLHQVTNSRRPSGNGVAGLGGRAGEGSQLARQRLAHRCKGAGQRFADAGDALVGEPVLQGLGDQGPRPGDLVGDVAPYVAQVELVDHVCEVEPARDVFEIDLAGALPVGPLQDVLLVRREPREPRGAQPLGDREADRVVDVLEALDNAIDEDRDQLVADLEVHRPEELELPAGRLLDLLERLSHCVADRANHAAQTVIVIDDPSRDLACHHAELAQPLVGAGLDRAADDAAERRADQGAPRAKLAPNRAAELRANAAEVAGVGAAELRLAAAGAPQPHALAHAVDP